MSNFTPYKPVSLSDMFKTSYIDELSEMFKTNHIIKVVPMNTYEKHLYNEVIQKHLDLRKIYLDYKQY